MNRLERLPYTFVGFYRVEEQCKGCDKHGCCDVAKGDCGYADFGYYMHGDVEFVFDPSFHTNGYCLPCVTDERMPLVKPDPLEVEAVFKPTRWQRVLTWLDRHPVAFSALLIALSVTVSLFVRMMEGRNG